MSVTKVISPKNLPARLPLWTSVTAWLFLDRLSAPAWVLAVAASLFARLWGVSIFLVWTQQTVDLKELQ